MGGATVVIHGHHNSLTYQSWEAAIQRCTNPKHSSYRNYGGRGISVCERWRRDFAAFLADVGERPSAAHSIDRYPNHDGNYEPGNCRWATRTEQNRNTRATKLTEADVHDIRQSPERNADIARRYKIHRSTVSKIRSGDAWREVGAQTARAS